MDNLFQELGNTLEKIQGVFQELLRITMEKQKQLVLGNIQEIERLTHEEEGLVFSAGSLENERYKLARQLINDFQLQEGATLTDIIQVAPEAEKSRLQLLQEDMRKLADKIDKVNQENILLIEQSLKFINFTVDVLTGPEGLDTYDTELDKGSKRENISRILDKKI